MRSKELPFNVELLKLTPAQLQTMRPVTSIDFFENANGDLHEDGLFSIPIFGRIGSEERDQRFSYVDIKLEIFHPVIFERLTKLKAIYKGILEGTQYATWDEARKDFVASDEVSGSTGYSFFMHHWRKIEFARNDSVIRDVRIQLIEKYRDRATTSRIVILPAGLRDIETGDDGRTEFSDINTIYRKLISVASTIPDSEQRHLDPVHDRARVMLQNAFNELYKYLEQMITGKTGFFQSKWASRAIFDSTRNVITSADLSTDYLGGANATRYTDTTFGLYQLSRMLRPKVIFFLRSGYLSQIFSHGDNRALLVDPVTLEGEVVDISSNSYDRWVTNEGLEKVLASYGEVALRDRPIMIEGRYLALIYVGPDATFKVFHDINELPGGLDRKHVRPISLVELLYLSGYRHWGDFIAVVTRYPVTGVGSCYPSTTRVKTTIVGEMRRELGMDWVPIGDDHVATEFPILPATAYLDSQVVNSQRLAGLGADFDGDAMAATCIYTDEALAEQKRYLASRNAYVDPRGGLRASSAVPTIELVVLNMLGRV